MAISKGDCWCNQCLVINDGSDGGSNGDDDDGDGGGGDTDADAAADDDDDDSYIHIFIYSYIHIFIYSYIVLCSNFIFHNYESYDGHGALEYDAMDMANWGELYPRDGGWEPRKIGGLL